MSLQRLTEASKRSLISIFIRPPPVFSHQGDLIRIHATNGLGDDTVGTSLHSHGMFFNNSNHYDGAVGVTQCSIPRGQTLTYDIDTSKQVSRLLVVHLSDTYCRLLDWYILDPRSLSRSIHGRPANS